MDQESLSTPGDGFQRVGWYGILLTVPVGWNVAYFGGNRRKGVLLLEDLRQVRMEVRWRTPAGFKGAARRGFGRQLARLKKGSVQVRTMGQVHSVGADTLMAADADNVRGGRIYEVCWPNGVDEVEVTRAAGELASMVNREGPDWYWEAYGAAGWVPGKAKLRLAKMLPGETRLEFRWHGGGAELGSQSLADRMLSGTTLAEWARTVLGVKVAFQEKDKRLSCALRRRRGLRQVLERVSVRHDAAANRICWTRIWGKGKKGV